MTDIYVLYKSSTGNESEVSGYVQQIIEKIRSYRSYVTKRAYSSDRIEESMSECANSTVLLAFFEDDMIHDESCRRIWNTFVKKQQTKKQQLVFPIELRKTELSTTEKNKDKKEMLLCASYLGYYTVSFDDKEKTANEIEKLACSIAESLKISSNKDNGDSKGNVHIMQEEDDDGIDKIFGTQSSTEKARLINALITKATSQKKKYKANPVCAIYTGGTVGMIREQQDDLTAIQVPATLSKLVENLPRLNHLEFDVHFYSYDHTIDSSNITSKDWATLAEIIERLNSVYQGFVIIQGANTMAYTASALSFMLEDLDKPVILTGSELSLTDLNSDAEQNVIRALDAAAHITNKDIKITEVCVLFGKRLIRGNRATKQFSLDTAEGFYSPNFPDLASVTQDKINIDFSKLRSSDGTNLRNNRQMSDDKKIMIYDVYPDMDMNLFAVMCGMRDKHDYLDALIIRTYGTGGAPDKNEMFIDCLKNLIRNDKIVINLTQCPIGSVELRLFETNATLFDIGVVNGGDMVTEAAYCKLKHLFAKHSNIRNIKTKNQTIINDMSIDLRGELTLSTFVIRFYKKSDAEDGYILEEDKWETSSEYSVNSERHTPVKISDKSPLYSAIMRFEKLEILTGDVSEPLELLIERYINEDTHPPLGADKRMFGNSDDKSIDINIDITNKAKEMIELTKPFALRIKSCHHEVRFQSLSVVFSVREG